MRKSPLPLLCYLSALLTLSACVSAPPPKTEWQNHQSTIKKIKQFTAKGKVAFISPEQRISATFHWRQTNEDLSLRVTNFLGNTLLKLDASPTHATLTDNNGQAHVGTTATNLIKELTGVALPIEDMTDWIKGIPSDKNSFTLGADDRLSHLSQFKNKSNPGWQVNYDSYDPATNNLLPSKIPMNLNDQKVNLVISTWTYEN